MKLSDQQQHETARFNYAERLVGQVFGDSAFLTPLEFAQRALGWAPSTSYKYSAGIGGRRFPIRLQKIGSVQMVSALDYLDYLLAGGSSVQSETPARQPKKRGRRSNEERARLAAEQTSSSSH